MSRRRKIENEQVLAIVRGLLLRQGLQITTRDLAAEVGVSEGVLFQRFGSKEALVRAALTLPEMNPAQLIANATQGKDARTVLENIAVAIFAAFRELLPLYIPRLSHPQFESENAWTSRKSPFQLFLDPLEQHLKTERHAGRIQLESAYTTAYLIVSSLHHTALMETIAGPSTNINEGTVRDLIGILWLGLQPRP